MLHSSGEGRSKAHCGLADGFLGWYWGYCQTNPVETAHPLERDEVSPLLQRFAGYSTSWSSRIRNVDSGNLMAAWFKSGDPSPRSKVSCQLETTK